MSEEKKLEGPDLSAGVPVASIVEGKPLLGHVDGEQVVVVRKGDQFFAIGATCTHQGGPLADGVVVGDTVRCPWHHASFCLRNGQALRAPALGDVASYPVEQRGSSIHVGSATAAPGFASSAAPTTGSVPASVLIVGGGAAGQAAAEQLRRDGYGGPITMLSADSAAPYDRTNLSKYYLAGNSPASDLPLRPAEFYGQRHIDLRLGTRVSRIDPAKRQVVLDSGESLEYGALLLATGATPVKLDIPGADRTSVHYLRTRDDCDALIAAAGAGKRAVVIGASFIGLEVASSLRKRGVQVQVVGRETVLMQRVLGEQVGHFLQRMHEKNEVVFHLGTSPTAIDDSGVRLDNGKVLPADFVVIGVGVRPATALAEQAGLKMDRGVAVDPYLATSQPGIYAAGDIARWPDRLSGAPIRVEHWVVAMRMGQCAARNMLGKREAFDMVPFFWTEQVDFGLGYVGHAENFDEIEIDGDLQARKCRILYKRNGTKLAVGVVHEDHAGLLEEVEFERRIAAQAGQPAS